MVVSLMWSITGAVSRWCDPPPVFLPTAAMMLHADHKLKSVNICNEWQQLSRLHFVCGIKHFLVAARRPRGNHLPFIFWIWIGGDTRRKVGWPAASATWRVVKCRVKLTSPVPRARAPDPQLVVYFPFRLLYYVVLMLLDLHFFFWLSLPKDSWIDLDRNKKKCKLISYSNPSEFIFMINFGLNKYLVVQ